MVSVYTDKTTRVIDEVLDAVEDEDELKSYAMKLAQSNIVI